MPGRMSWGAVFAGALVSLGVWFLLHIFGIGVGMTAIDPQDASSLRAVGIGTGIWSVLAPILALFIGGLAAGRVAGALTRGGAAIHGAVIWALTTLAALVALIWVLGALIGGVVGAGVSGVQAAMGADAESLEALGVDTEDMLAPVNQRLAEEGLPPVTADELAAASQDALSTAVREGRFDRALLVQSLTDNTDMSRAEAEQVATQIETEFGARWETVQQQALEAARATGRALLVLFLALLLGLIAAIGGTVLGVSREQRLAAHSTAGPVPAHP